MSVNWRSYMKKKILPAGIFSLLMIFLILSNLTTDRIPTRFTVDRKSHLFSQQEDKLSGSLTQLDIHPMIGGKFGLNGSIVNENGIHKEIQDHIEMSLVYSFSPQTEEHFRDMLIDPDKQQHQIFANSPAILRTGDGGLLAVMRIWLEKEIWDLTKSRPTNTFSDNYFFIQRFDRHMKPVSKGRILGIPTPIQWTVGDGPIEPRLFAVNGTVYITFNTGVFSPDQVAIDSTFIWDLSEERALLPVIYGGNPMLDNTVEKSMPRDKHWSAIVNQTKLYFVYNMDPLRVIDCHLDRDALCKFIHKEGPEDWTFRDSEVPIRGGSPFVLYSYPFYISIVHGTFFKDCPDGGCDFKRFYTTHLVVMTVEPDFKVLYISRNLPYPEKSLRVPIVRYRFIEDSFFFPVGLILEDLDSIIIGGHINDHSSVLYRFTGLASIMNQVSQYHSAYLHKPGPKPGFLHNLTRSQLSKDSGIKFHE